MDAKDIKDLILTIDKTTIETVEIEKGDIKLRITKKTMFEGNNVEQRSTKSAINDNIDSKAVNADNEAAKTKVDNSLNSDDLLNSEDFYIVKSPIVGTFYEGASPDTPPFVKVGDRVEKGRTLCIIEAMKIMNEIESEESGEVIEVLVDDEDIVEYGQPLMKIRR